MTPSRSRSAFAATAGLESDTNHALKVVVSPTAAADGPLNNLMRNRKITPATAGFGASRVGDGKLFGVDGARPLHAGVFTSIALDLDRLTTVKDDTMGVGDGNPPYVQQIQITTEQGSQSGAESEYRLHSGRQGGQN